MTDTKKRRKPRGIQGTTSLDADGTARFTQAALPETKEEIEQVVISAFDRVLDRLTRHQFGITGFSKSAEESDLDCIIHSNDGDFRMELTEMVKEDLSRGGHEAAHARRTIGEGADMMLQQIRTKSGRYATRADRWLLMYPTAWQFGTSPGEFVVVRHSLLREPPRFSRIYVLEHPAEVDPFLALTYPVGLPALLQIVNADLNGLRGRISLRLDPRRFEFRGMPKGTQFSVRT